MRLPYLLFFLCLNAFSETSPRIQVIPNPQSNEDFDHQYKGCLENSECDQVMGLQLNRWKELLNKLKNGDMSAEKKAQFMELFRAKYGIPVEFYTTEKSQQGFKPMLFNSSCKEHNQKGQPKIVKGTAFIKSLSKEKAVVWRDQTQIEVPTGEIMIPQPVFVYEGATPIRYELPLGDQPLFIQNKDLIVLKEEDGFFYALRISRNGNWKVDYLDFSKLSEWEDKRSEVPCPKDTTKLSPKPFNVEFCKSIWDDDQKKNVIVKLFQGCAVP